MGWIGVTYKGGILVGWGSRHFCGQRKWKWENASRIRWRSCFQLSRSWVCCKGLHLLFTTCESAIGSLAWKESNVLDRSKGQEVLMSPQDKTLAAFWAPSVRCHEANPVEPLYQRIKSQCTAPSSLQQKVKCPSRRAVPPPLVLPSRASSPSFCF